MKYLALGFAIFFTLGMISYLVHLNDLNLPLPEKKQWIDIAAFLAFSAYWSFVVYLFN